MYSWRLLRRSIDLLAMPYSSQRNFYYSPQIPFISQLVTRNWQHPYHIPFFRVRSGPLTRPLIYSNKGHQVRAPDGTFEHRRLSVGFLAHPDEIGIRSEPDLHASYSILQILHDLVIFRAAGQFDE